MLCIAILQIVSSGVKSLQLQMPMNYLLICNLSDNSYRLSVFQELDTNNVSINSDSNVFAVNTFCCKIIADSWWALKFSVVANLNSNFCKLKREEMEKTLFLRCNYVCCDCLGLQCNMQMWFTNYSFIKLAFVYFWVLHAVAARRSNQIAKFQPQWSFDWECQI